MFLVAVLVRWRWLLLYYKYRTFGYVNFVSFVPGLIHFKRRKLFMLNMRQLFIKSIYQLRHKQNKTEGKKTSESFANVHNLHVWRFGKKNVFGNRSFWFNSLCVSNWKKISWKFDWQPQVGLYTHTEYYMIYLTSSIVLVRHLSHQSFFIEIIKRKHYERWVWW